MMLHQKKFLPLRELNKKKLKKGKPKQEPTVRYQAPKDDNIGSKVEKLNPVPVDPVAINNIEESKQNENKKNSGKQKGVRTFKKTGRRIKESREKTTRN